MFGSHIIDGDEWGVKADLRRIHPTGYIQFRSAVVKPFVGEPLPSHKTLRGPYTEKAQLYPPPAKYSDQISPTGTSAQKTITA